ncbi:hypothetical protein ACGC1H_006768 [Rhizoctonia solani]
MDARYSKVSNTSIEPNSIPSSDAKGSHKIKSTIVTSKNLKTWIGTVLPLVIHCIFSVGITLFVVCYIKDRPFNTTDHIASVQTIEERLPVPFSLTQSDVVTILSALIVIQKWSLTAWVAPLCWRVVILLMERHGLHRRDLRALVKYRLLTPWTYLKSFPTFLIGTLLIASLVANLVSPILTGSIAWSPRNIPIHNLPTSPIRFQALDETGSGPGVNVDWPVYIYSASEALRERLTQEALSLVGIAWQRDKDKGVFKRVSQLVEALPINSTIENLILPYFVTHSIEWIKNENDIPAYVKDINPRKSMYESLRRSPNINAELYHGTALLVPDLSNPTNWSSSTLVPRAIEEKRLLIYWLGHSRSNITQGLPLGTYIYTEELAQVQFALAWVTYSAGVGRCKDYHCIVSSRFTMQNNTPIELEPHRFTLHALYLALPVATLIVKQNTSLPYSWDNPNDFIEALLLRSYFAAWNILADNFLLPISDSNYRPALPSLVASVNKPRVFGWLGTQLSVTLLSIIFLVLQSRLSKFPLLGDADLTAFYLDTTELPESDSPHLFVDGALKVREEDNRLKVKVE